jgi:arsenite-transporting ATPase
MNIDPEMAAEAYRERVLAQLAPETTEMERAAVREQLSGACTTEIAAFDEFADLLAGGAEGFDHVIFDTAPTGHTLRLLSLPKAWSGFLAENDRGASCLGPHSGLTMQEAKFNAALKALGDPTVTAIALVTRPERSALLEAARTARELAALGMRNQWLIVNGVFHASLADDALAASFEALGRDAMAAMPEVLRALPRDEVPLHGFDMVGMPALRALLRTDDVPAAPPIISSTPPPNFPGLGRLVDELAAKGSGLVMVMGKGGVGKTTVAAAVAIGLVERGLPVHLSTTDPAAHLLMALAGDALPGLRVDRIDPKAETDRYVERIMSTRGLNLDEEGRALLREDLRSPCTEEVAVFHAFSRIVSEARSAFVVLDTAPTGHTLLLMDATGAYHRQMMHDLDPQLLAAGRIVTPLMRLQDPDYTHIVLVALPETTPVSEAASLQEDLRRARIEPWAWVVNRSLLAAGTRDPLLRQRLEGERRQIERIHGKLAQRMFVLPWQVTPPVGLQALGRLVT